MTDHDFIVDMQARCAAQLAGTVTPPDPPPIKPPEPPPTGTFPYQPVTLTSNASVPINMQDGVVYACKLPSTAGTFGMTATVSTPAGTKINVSVSEVPGDINWGKTNGCYDQWGAKQCPCGSYNGSGESAGGVNWATVKNPNQVFCVMPAGTGYLNFQMTGGSGSMFYTWNPL